jgi:hypothetical protein
LLRFTVEKVTNNKTNFINWMDVVVAAGTWPAGLLKRMAQIFQNRETGCAG